jgi:single-stranded DNA-binding protein
LTQTESTIEGTVLTAPSLQVTQFGKPFTKFDIGVAGTHPVLQIHQQVTVHIVTWTDLAEYAEEYIKVGQNLKFTGRFETRPYTDKNGNQRQWTDFTAFVIKRGNTPLRNTGFIKTEEEEAEEKAGEITPAWEETANGRTGESQTVDTSGAETGPSIQG